MDTVGVPYEPPRDSEIANASPPILSKTRQWLWLATVSPRARIASAQSPDVLAVDPDTTDAGNSDINDRLLDDDHCVAGHDG